MLNLAIFGGSKLDGSSLEMDEPLTSLALFGGAELDFSAAPPPPDVAITAIAIFGGITVKVHPEQVVRLSGWSVFGGKSVEPQRRLPPPEGGNEDFEEPLEITAYTVFGGLAVKRA